MDEAQIYGPRDYPHKGPILGAWGGHYDHAYIALHPFTYVGVTQHALDSFGGELPFEGFAVTSDTTSSWVIKPGTYSYPGWLA